MTATTMAALLTRTAPMDATAAANKVTLVAAVRCPLHALLPEIAVTTAPPLTRTELMDAIAAAMEVTRALRVLYLHHVMRRSIAVVKATPPTQTAQMVANATALKDFQVPNAKQRFAFQGTLAWVIGGMSMYIEVGMTSEAVVNATIIAGGLATVGLVATQLHKCGLVHLGGHASCRAWIM
jgi:hypothetical protein